MSGKMVRNQGASEPAAIAFLVIIGLMISAAIGAVVVLWKAHLLSAHTPWARVPGALWSMRHLPIVWKPFLAGFFIAFAVCLIGIVSSLFTGQKLHGEARWARIGEVRKAKLLEDAGILLGRINGKFMRFGGTEHVLLEAPTRAGKGVGVVIPNLLQWPDSVVVLDVKQENWAATAGFRMTNLRQQTLLFNPLDAHGRTCRYNPLAYINRRDQVEVVNELQKISVMLFPLPLQGETFWAESARTAFLGVAAYVAATADDGDDALPFTIGEIYRQFAAGDAQKRFPKIISQREREGKPLSGACVSALRDWIMASANTFTSTRQSVTAKINLWLNPYVDAATAVSDFDLREFRDKRISLYLGVSPDDLDRVAPIYGLLFQQLIDLNVRELPSGNKHQVRLLLLLDEFSRLGRASVIANGFSYVAGYGIRLLPVIQSGAQLENVYGPKVATEIESNCGVQMVMRPATNDDAKDISERLGTYTFRAKSRSFGMWGRGGGSVSESDQRRPLMLPQELMQLPEKDMIVLRLGIPPVYGKKIRYYTEKAMVALTKIPAPQMPNIRPDPTAPINSLRVIAAAEADDNGGPGSAPPANGPGPQSGGGGTAPTHHRLNQAAIAAAMAAPAGERTSKLFQHIVMVGEPKVA
ncbi:type IV secretory system conjugative DNA transfer family protein (plasmid) [Sphingomonas sp. AAP5]|uniref:type IV secretory system conjugative DNA transfer family protein n=1 Tax=Sphingomonas sp. AAP5 TaxID=1523415 RepID=UPI0010570C7C|nr:type IV secretory system conjugative DNA transfer family protein [Sphingomonas sp. AAP5]QBM77978.1 type IV secretory system conjugative DNA transfer family protein [Sphingomonas sp. AAP5]